MNLHQSPTGSDRSDTPGINGYLPGLDGLRALSVLVVVAFHTGLIDGGWIGVDVFFAISGFLITGLLVTEHRRSGHISLGAFWMRRIRRLVPALVLLLGLVALLVGLDEVEVRARDVWGAITYSTNWVHILGGSSYWDAFATPDPLRHLWSLAIEEQFYLVWPVIATFVLRRGTPRTLMKVAAGGALVSAVAQVGFIHAGLSIDRVYQGTDTRAVAFLLGAMLACGAPRNSGERRFSTSPVTRFVTISVLVGAAIWLPGDRTWVFSGPLLVVSVSGALAVRAAAASQSGFLHHPVLRAVGRWSYGIYLFHWPLTVTDRLSGTSAPVRFLVVTVASTALAALSFRFVEAPIRHRRVDRRLFPAIALVGVAVVVISLATSSSPAPAIDTSVTLAPITGTETGTDTGTDTDTDTGTGTGTDADTRATRVMVFGDSIPAVAAYELGAVGRDLGLEVEVRADPGCVPSEDPRDQYGKPECVDFLRGTADRARAIGIDVAVIWWGGTGKGFQEKNVPYFFCESGDVTRERIRRLVDYFPADSEIYLVAPVPRTDLGDDDAAGTTCEIEAYAEVASEVGATLIDLRPLVCPSFPDDCRRVERYDGMHYDGDAASTVAREILGRVVT